MKIENVTAKKIYVSEHTYILCVPYDDRAFYEFYMMHDKIPACLKMFGSTAAQCLDEETMIYLAVNGFEAHKEEYIKLVNFIDD